MKIQHQPTKLEKNAKRGHRGYPAATVAFYGPDSSRASKVVVGIVPSEAAHVTELRKWSSATSDVRRDAQVNEAILAFIREFRVKTVIMSPGIIGCPHEEGIDYPEGHVCPVCPFWASRDRWSGEELPEE